MEFTGACVLLNQGDGTFAAPVNYAMGTAPQSIAVGDLDGDGKTDLASGDGWNVRVMPGDGAGGLGAGVLYATGGGVTGATDLYSLGVILYEALSGRLPFQSELPLALLMKHVSAVVPPLVVDQHPPDVPQALNDLVFRLLEKDPAKRPSTAMELAGLLSEIDFQGPKAGRPLPVTTVARRLAGRFDAASAAIPVSRVTGETAAAPAGTLQPPGKHPLGPVALLTRRGGRWWRPVVVALIVALWVAVGVIAFALRQSL